MAVLAAQETADWMQKASFEARFLRCYCCARGSATYRRQRASDRGESAGRLRRPARAGLRPARVLANSADFLLLLCPNWDILYGMELGEYLGIVIGSRDWADWPRLASVCDRVLRPGCVLVWSGGARGADYLAWQWAIRRQIQFCVWSANWAAGKSAGPARSREMMAAAKRYPLPVRVLAFLSCPTLADSRGTAAAVEAARACDLPVYLVSKSSEGWYE